MTFSIVAVDQNSGELGVAVQSRYLAVGAAVPWVRAGIGAVATQALVEPGYGPAALDALEVGTAPSEALSALLAADAGAETRQVAVLAAGGAKAVHTGSDCIPVAEHIDGDGFIALGNLLAIPGTVTAMAAAFQTHRGGLTQKLLAALGAGEAHGGDLRGAQSAALVVAAPGTTHAEVNLRVDDHPQPTAELRRLVDLHESYSLLGDGIDALLGGSAEDAAEPVKAALRRQPGNPQFEFWGDVVAGRSAAHLGLRWADYEQRLIALGKIPAVG